MKGVDVEMKEPFMNNKPFFVSPDGMITALFLFLGGKISKGDKIFKIIIITSLLLFSTKQFNCIQCNKCIL